MSAVRFDSKPTTAKQTSWLLQAGCKQQAQTGSQPHSAGYCAPCSASGALQGDVCSNMPAGLAAVHVQRTPTCSHVSCTCVLLCGSSTHVCHVSLTCAVSVTACINALTGCINVVWYERWFYKYNSHDHDQERQHACWCITDLAVGLVCRLTAPGQLDSTLSAYKAYTK